MSIYLGNLSVSEIEDRVGVKFPAEVAEEMNGMRQDNAQHIAPGKWHCFDMPFIIVCGDSPVAEFMRDKLGPIAPQFKCALQVGIA